MTVAASRAAPLRLSGLPHQIELWTDQTQDARIGLVGPQGSGKTRGLCIKGLLLASANHETDGMLVVPTFPIARMTHVPEWPRIWRDAGIDVQFHTSDSAFIFPWGARLWLRSAERAENLISANLGYLLVDEPASMDRLVWDKSVGRVRDQRAAVRQVVATGTPEGYNWFADLFRDPRPPYKTIWAAGWHPDMTAYRDALFRDYAYDDSLLSTYALGQFVPLRQGRCFPHFVRQVHAGTPVAFDPAGPLVLACDFNVDAMRWLVCQVLPREIHVLDEIAMGRGAHTQETVREFVRRWNGRTGEVIVTGDASGRARSTSGSFTDYQIIEEELRRAFERVRMVVPHANPHVKDTVENVNYHLAGRGRKVVVSPFCKELIADLEQVCWRQGTQEQDKNSDLMRTHASDAFRCMAYQLAPAFRESRTRVVAPEPVRHYDVARETAF